ncbi:hypothetical protein EVAR_18508_1 [Eumeta japonica]|uniref:Uncharacterized protein n=1 Tax=Eumeta variegata TaxID=151549 RepID=A0A4C1V0F9_EUMVA|nr:hypothetical protein EVAR_18508_1 [Eumeta japonica]
MNDETVNKGQGLHAVLTGVQLYVNRFDVNRAGEATKEEVGYRNAHLQDETSCSGCRYSSPYSARVWFCVKSVIGERLHHEKSNYEKVRVNLTNSFGDPVMSQSLFGRDNADSACTGSRGFVLRARISCATPIPYHER